MKVGVSKILMQSKPKGKLVLALVGMFLSMVVISSVFQLFQDVSYLLDENESKDGFEYIQISKEVGVSTTLGLSSADFSSKEIQKIKKQEFIDDVGALSSNDFRVYGRFAGNAFDMFFTSVEDEFIDADLDDFSWSKGDLVIPVIISNQFLTILNHAVLPSQGQPAIPKIAIKQATVDLSLTKDGKRLNQKARVVGFSDRISSVLVPKNFLDYANQELAGKKDTRVSMLLLKVKDTGSKQLRRFLNKNDYEVSGEMPMVDNAKTILKIVIVVLLVFGIIILFLSIGLNLSQFELMVAQNKARIRMLVLLGYSSKQIIQSILKSSLSILGVVVLAVFISIWLVFSIVHEVMIDFKLGYPELSLLTFLIPLIIVFTFLIGLSKTLKNLIRV